MRHSKLGHILEPHTNGAYMNTVTQNTAWFHQSQSVPDSNKTSYLSFSHGTENCNHRILTQGQSSPKQSVS